jgi:hypothetical protein
MLATQWISALIEGLKTNDSEKAVHFLKTNVQIQQIDKLSQDSLPSDVLFHIKKNFQND